MSPAAAPILPGAARNALATAFSAARQGLRARRRRALLTGLGILLAAAMLSAAVVLSYGLGTGFDRAASAAGLPDIIARFNDVPESTVLAKIRALPDIARVAFRDEVNGTQASYENHSSGDVTAEVLDSLGPSEGYVIVAGHRLAPRGSEVLVEKGFADAWGIHLGSELRVAGLGLERVVGIAEGPDDVGYPLGVPRIYLSMAAVERHFGVAMPRDPQVDLADIYLRNAAYVNQVLTQARSISHGLTGVQFATRSGIRIILSQAAGIVIDLLVALSIIALVTAGVLLAASARAEVQRRLGAIGVRRAIGETRGQVALSLGLEGLLVAVPFGTVGVAAGVLATLGATGRLLTLLNEPAPGWSLAAPVLGAWLLAILVPALGAAWPAWRAAGGPVVGLLRGRDVAARPSARGKAGRRSGRRPGLVSLGARLVAARRARLAATVVTLGLSTGFVLLLLALASELSSLETDPGALGKHYQLTATLPASAASRVGRIPGVAGVEPRYELEAADSFELGETIDVIAYPRQHTRFEAPPLTSGSRYRGAHEAEVGAGLANALGLNVGSVLAIELPSGIEQRYTVSGIVSSLDHEGRVAYVPSATLLRGDPSAPEQLAVIVKPGASVSSVTAALGRLGGEPATAAGAVARGVPLVDVLRTILVAVAVVDGLVCLYALIQACGLTVFERRRTIAVLRAAGGGPSTVARVLLGAVLVLVVPAGVAGVLLERLLLGPEVSRLAENYATLPLDAGPVEVAAVVAGLLVATSVAVGWVTREAARESVVEGLAG